MTATEPIPGDDAHPATGQSLDRGEPRTRAHDATNGVSRRRLLTALGTAGAVGAAGTLLPLSNTAAQGATIASTANSVGPATARPQPPGAPIALFSDGGLNYAALSALGDAAYGVTEVGEVLTAVAAVNATGGSYLYPAYAETFLQLANRLAKLSAQARYNGDAITSADRALRAAQYYAQSLFYILATDQPGREQAVFQAGRNMWDQWVASRPTPVERLAIPWQGTTLPGWLFRPDCERRRRPTLIMNNGSDGQSVDMWAQGAAAGLERGWNVVVFEGPGQGEPLFVRKIPFSPRWEQVISPIIDLLVQRAAVVDRHRIALMGISMGGDLVSRAAAFEHRLAALVCAPGVTSPWLGFPPELRKVITGNKDQSNEIWNTDVVPNLPAMTRFVLAKRYEPFGPAAITAARQGGLPTDIWTPSQLIEFLDVTAVADRISCPTLVLDYEGEQFYPGQSRRLYELLRTDKTLIDRTVAEGAQLHDSPMAPRFHSETVFDWLNSTLSIRE